MQFADIKNDIAFRKIFGNENKTEILISFLNAVLKLEGTKQITWVEILNPYQLPRIVGSKSTILDVRAKDKSGNSYIVELKPIIFIGILNFEYMQSPNYLSRHLILDAETQEHKLKDLEFTFIELPKFNKTEQDLQAMVEKWVFFIKNAENLNVIPASVNDEGLKSAYQEADRHNWTKEELEEYEYARMRETDEIAEKMLLEEKAELRKQIQMAKTMLADNEPNERIAKYTGLTVEQIVLAP
jgi:DNA-directed RNA polymerase subunit H (RpoH/RPB5)